MSNASLYDLLHLTVLAVIEIFVAIDLDNDEDQGETFYFKTKTKYLTRTTELVPYTGHKMNTSVYT